MPTRVPCAEGFRDFELIDWLVWFCRASRAAALECAPALFKGRANVHRRDTSQWAMIDDCRLSFAVAVFAEARSGVGFLSGGWL